MLLLSDHTDPWIRAPICYYLVGTISIRDHFQLAQYADFLEMAIKGCCAE